MAEKKRWRIEAVHLDERKENWKALKIVAYRTAEDAGAAWLHFSKRLSSVRWQSISVTEVKRSE